MDPLGNKNRCFYQSIATFLDISATEAISLIEDYMICHQVISVTNSVSSVI